DLVFPGEELLDYCFGLIGFGTGEESEGAQIESEDRNIPGKSPAHRGEHGAVPSHREHHVGPGVFAGVGDLTTGRTDQLTEPFGESMVGSLTESDFKSEFHARKT